MTTQTMHVARFRIKPTTARGGVITSENFSVPEGVELIRDDSRKHGWIAVCDRRFDVTLTRTYRSDQTAGSITVVTAIPSAAE